MLGVKGIDYWGRYTQFINWCKAHPPGEGEPVERHHILPRSLFPAVAKAKDNLISLTPRQHFVAHYILAHLQWVEMAHAFFFMRTGKWKHCGTSRTYAFAKDKLIALRKTSPHWQDAMRRSFATRSKNPNFIAIATANLKNGDPEVEAKRRAMYASPEWKACIAARNKRIAKTEAWKKAQSAGAAKSAKNPEWIKKNLDAVRRLATDENWLARTREGSKRMAANPAWRAIHCHPVRCIETGEVFESIQETIKRGVGSMHISEAIKNGWKCKGVHWEYVNA